MKNYPLDLAALASRSDRWFVYIDDTGPAGDRSAEPILPADRKTYVAVVLSPEQHEIAADVMRQILDKFTARTGEPEIHCSDMMSGKGGYAQMPVEERLDFFEALADMFEELGFSLVVQSIDVRNSLNIIQRFASRFPDGVPFFSLKKMEDLALFLLLTRLRGLLRSKMSVDERAVVIIDEGWKSANTVVSFKAWADLFHDGLLISASSALVPGLQLADFAAFALNRHQRLLGKGSLSERDARFFQITNKLVPLWVNLEAQLGELERNEDGSLRIHLTEDE